MCGLQRVSSNLRDFAQTSEKCCEAKHVHVIVTHYLKRFLNSETNFDQGLARDSSFLAPFSQRQSATISGETSGPGWWIGRLEHRAGASNCCRPILLCNPLRCTLQANSPTSRCAPFAISQYLCPRCISSVLWCRCGGRLPGSRCYRAR